MTRDLDTEGPVPGQERIDVTKPRLLDLFCGAGGAGMGYSQAGFDVIGVDIKPMPNNPFRTYVADVSDPHLWGDLIRRGTFDGISIDAIHASPPCQRYSTATADPERHPDLVPVIRDLLVQTGLPYVIENVPQAPLIDPAMLCGSSFDLGVRRHRVFETSFPTKRRPSCLHKAQGTPVGVYGDHPDTREFYRPDGTRRGAKATSLEQGRQAMGIDWMTWKELAEAIPPAYTRWIGAQLMTNLHQGEPCDLGPCAAPRGHDGTCLEASGWAT